MDHTIRCHDVSFNDIRSVNSHLSIFDNNIHLLALNGFCSVEFHHIGCQDFPRNDVISEDALQLLFVFRLQKFRNRFLREFSECIVRWSKYCEGTFAFECLNQSCGFDSSD